MISSFQKMIRAAGANTGTAFLAWKMWVLSSDRVKMKQQKRNMAAKNIGDVLEKKRKRHLRSVIRPLASGVAQTKMQLKIMNRMYYIAYGRLKTAFRMWTEELSKYNNLLNAKREEIVRKIAMAAMSKHQFAFYMWKNWTQKELNDENLMKKMINRMLRSAGLMQYGFFTRWKMDTFTDIERKRTMKKNKILNGMFDLLDKKHRNHMKVGYSKLAGESMNTAARQRMVGRLG
jgi:hypothetical protein